MNIYAEIINSYAAAITFQVDPEYVAVLEITKNGEIYSYYCSIQELIGQSSECVGFLRRGGFKLPSATHKEIQSHVEDLLDLKNGHLLQVWERVIA